MRDLASNIDLKRGISPQVAVTNNDPFVSQILDTRGLKSATFVLLTGSLADVDATFVVLAEDGDAADLSDNVAIANEFLVGTEVLAAPLFSGDNKVFKLGLLDTRRYARVTVTPAANTGDVYLSGVWITEPNLKPTANPPA